MNLTGSLRCWGIGGTRQFLFGSLQLFGGVNGELRQLAEELLAKISPRSRDNSKGKRLNATAFARQAQAEIEHYRQIYPDLSAKVQIREDTVGLMVSQGNLLIGRHTKIAQSRVEALLQHEVGTHVLTYFTTAKPNPFSSYTRAWPAMRSSKKGWQCWPSIWSGV